MDEYEPYSKRLQHGQLAGQPRLFVYDNFPMPFRVQAFNALSDGIGWNPLTGRAFRGSSIEKSVWEEIEKTTLDEAGLYRPISDAVSARDRWRDYLLRIASPVEVVDAIEVAFCTLLVAANQYRASYPAPFKSAEPAVSRLNRRFDQHGLGYQFVQCAHGGRIIRRDSQFTHKEIVEPTIALLWAEGFTGPLDEFVESHRAYRRGDYDAAVNEAHKAFESTLKTICERRKWPISTQDTASKLIHIVIENGLISSTQAKFQNALASVLSSGVPTIRNSETGHGQGATVRETPAHLAAYAIHLAAANILYLVSSHQALTDE